jgi:hypothetical protein
MKLVRENHPLPPHFFCVTSLTSKSDREISLRNVWMSPESHPNNSRTSYLADLTDARVLGLAAPSCHTATAVHIVLIIGRLFRACGGAVTFLNIHCFCALPTSGGVDKVQDSVTKGE